MPVTATTELPVADPPAVSIDSSVSFPSVTLTGQNRADYGYWVADYRRDGDVNWTEFGFAQYDEATITREDIDQTDDIKRGVRYELRARNRTEHVVGSGSQPTTFVVPMPPPANLIVNGAGNTYVTLSWDSPGGQLDATNFRIEQRLDNDVDEWRVVDNDAPSTGNSYVIDGLSPDRTYEFRVAAVGEDEVYYTDATVTAETIGDVQIGRTIDIPTTGWHCIIQHPDGTKLTPTITGKPEWNAKLNDLPGVTIPVSPSDKWLLDSLTDAEMVVWKDGKKLPIDSFVDCQTRPGEYDLIGRGGSELLSDVETQFTDIEVTTAAERLIEDAGYTANVDQPNTTTTTGVVLQNAATTDQLSQAFGGSIDPATPARVANGQIETVQTAHWVQVNSEMIEQDSYETGNYSDERAVTFDDSNAGLEGSAEFTLNYAPPSDQPKIAIRCRVPNSDPPAFEVRIDDEVVWSRDTGTWNEGEDTTTWISSGELPVQLGEGDHTITLRNRGGGSNPIYMDAVVVRDTRYNYTWGEYNDVTGNPTGPQLYPDEVPINLGRIQAGQQVLYAEVDATFNDTSGVQALSVSNDDGATWTTAANADALEADFSSSPSTSISLRVTLGRHGIDDLQIPTDGRYPQALQSITVRGTLDSTPTLTGNSYEDSYLSVLQNLANYGDFIFEIRALDQATYRAPVFTIEWTQPGQRTTAESSAITAYEITKIGSKQYQRVTVQGASKPVRSESITVQTGSWVNLSHDRIIEGSPLIYDPDTDAQYEAGQDFHLDPLNGRVQALSTGGLNDGSTYRIDYKRRVTGTYTSPSAGSDPRKVTVDIPEANTQGRCEQVAVELVSQLDDPYYEARVTIPELSPEQSLVAAIDIDEIPTQGTPLEIADLTQVAGQTVLELGTRSPIDETVQRIRRQLSTTMQRV